MNQKTPKTDTCPQCHVDFKSICGHWAKSSSCDFVNYPKPLLDVLRGLLAVRGHISHEEPYNRFQISFTKEQIAVKMRNVFGLYANNIQLVEESGSVINGVEYAAGETYRLRLSPNHYIQSYADIDFSKSGELAVKTALYAKSVDRSNSIKQIQVPKKRSEIFEKAVPSYSSKYKRGDEMGHGYVNYTIPKDVVEKSRSVSWPIGWWNERYMA